MTLLSSRTLDLCRGVLAGIVVAVFFVHPASANMDAAERGVLADSEGFSSAGSAIDQDDAFSDALGTFDELVESSVILEAVAGRSFASQGTDVGGVAAMGWGSATAKGASIIPGDGFGEFAAESFTNIQFSVDTPTPFVLKFILASSVAGGGDAFSSLDLSDSTGRLLLSESVSMEGFSELTVMGILQPEVTYELSLLSRAIVQPGTFTKAGGASASYDFMLTIPEPSTGMLLFMGLSWIGVRARHRVGRPTIA